jgi:hypothetical protein
MNLLLDYTGKGQEKQLMSLMDMNLYHPKIEGKLKTLYAKEYVGYTHFNKNSLDVREFVVNEDTAAATPYGYYEPYGVISRHKNNEKSFGAIEKQIFSDGFWFMWTNDITDLAPTSKIDEAQAIGWVGKLTSDTTLSSNPFKPKTLLFKTQEVVNQGEAFLDLSKKEFTEVIDGESRIISRGDGTTASKTYTDDDKPKKPKKQPDMPSSFPSVNKPQGKGIKRSIPPRGAKTPAEFLAKERATSDSQRPK